MTEEYRGLWVWFGDFEELVEGRWGIEAMAAELTDLRFDDAALATERVAVIIRHAERQVLAAAAPLAGIWKAVEKNADGDWSKQTIGEAVEEWRTG